MILSYANFRALALASALTSAAVVGQAPQLVKNVNFQHLSGSSTPYEFIRAGRYTYFIANGVDGRELYRTFGYLHTTAQVADIRPGPASPNIQGMVALGDDLYFVADDGTHGRELWRFDGIGGKASMVIDFNPSTRETGISKPVVMGGDVYFIAVDHRYRPLLVRSDGSAKGTRTVAIISDVANQYATAGTLGVLNNRVFFEGGSAQAGRELWVSDGTAAGTGMLVDLVPGPGHSQPGGFVASDKHLYFTALTSSGGPQLHATDGTAANTVAVTSGKYLGAREVEPIGDALYFSLDDGVHGLEPWRSDGTRAGTAMVLDIYTGAAGSKPGDFCEFKGAVYFRAGNKQARYDNAELWRTDGTAKGTVLAVDLYPGDYGSKPEDMTVLGNEIVFSAVRDLTGFELYASDGTLAGTRLILNINRNPGKSSMPADFLLSGPANDRLVFRADDGNRGSEPWTTDGTARGTGQLIDIVGPTGFHNQDSDPEHLTDLFGTLLFVADDGIHGTELWRSDGTANGTMMIKDINPTGSSYPRDLEVCGTHAYFSAFDPVRGSELWRTDGTAPGTVLVADVAPGRDGSGPSHFVSLHGKVVFRAYTRATGHEVFVTDGTAAGTRLLRDIAAGAWSSFPYELTRMGEHVYFRASSMAAAPSIDYELWRTDGTASGTVLVKDIRPGTRGSTPGEFTAVEDRLFFFADDGSRGKELWISDGTSAGTVLVRDLRAGSLSSNPYGLTRVGDEVFFAASTPQYGNELFTSDGTTAGTRLVIDRTAGPASSRVERLVALGDQLYFQGGGLWRTDGTAAGTVLVTGTGGNNSFFGMPAAIGQRFLCFGVDHPGLGVEPTRTLGTGMKLLGDINPGAAFSLPDHFTLSGNRLYFRADHVIDGVELWSMPIDAHVQQIGAGHRIGGLAPELEASVPTLGSTLTVQVSRGEANRTGLLLLGAPTARPLNLGGGLVIYVDLVQVPVYLPIALDGRGEWRTGVPVPNNPALIGLTFAMQVGVDSPGTSPLGVATTPGVRAMLGR